jgi:hypothetical protein
MADALPLFQNPLHDLGKGIIMSINGVDMVITTGILAFTGDMPQQAKNSGALSHQATIGCRVCHHPRSMHSHLNLNFQQYGRYHFQTKSFRAHAATIHSISMQKKYLTSKGLSSNPSPLETLAPTLNLILSRPPDILHSEWNGLGIRLQALLLNSILNKHGQSKYLAAFQRFKSPSKWPRLQSPLRYLKSWTLTEAGCSILLTPLILRCNAESSWFNKGYLAKARVTLLSLI